MAQPQTAWCAHSSRITALLTGRPADVLTGMHAAHAHCYVLDSPGADHLLARDRRQGAGPATSKGIEHHATAMD